MINIIVLNHSRGSRFIKASKKVARKLFDPIYLDINLGRLKKF